MSYLEQFARNKRRKEPTTTLTARLPESLYNQFKDHCDELGLSISEAINLLVERETSANNKGAENTSSPTNEYINKDDAIIINTKPTIKKTVRMKTNTKRFTVKQWEVDGQLPCPICSSWIGSTNFARHAKQHHGTTTQNIFSNDDFKHKITAMMEKRTANTEG